MENIIRLIDGLMIGLSEVYRVIAVSDRQTAYRQLGLLHELIFML